jgi:hypothetical protein
MEAVIWWRGRMSGREMATSVNWRADLLKMWAAASLLWAVALHVLIAIEKPPETA